MSDRIVRVNLGYLQDLEKEVLSYKHDGWCEDATEKGGWPEGCACGLKALQDRIREEVNE